MKPEEKNVDAIKAKLDEVNKKVQAISTELYQKVAQEQAAQQQAQQQAAGTGEESSEKPKDENVVDADYKVEDEK